MNLFQFTQRDPLQGQIVFSEPIDMNTLSQTFMDMFEIYWYKQEDSPGVRRQWRNVLPVDFNGANSTVTFEVYGEMEQ